MHSLLHDCTMQQLNTNLTVWSISCIIILLEIFHITILSLISNMHHIIHCITIMLSLVSNFCIQLFSFAQAKMRIMIQGNLLKYEALSYTPQFSLLSGGGWSVRWRGDRHRHRYGNGWKGRRGHFRFGRGQGFQWVVLEYLELVHDPFSMEINIEDVW